MIYYVVIVNDMVTVNGIDTVGGITQQAMARWIEESAKKVQRRILYSVFCIRRNNTTLPQTRWMRSRDGNGTRGLGGSSTLLACTEKGERWRRPRQAGMLHLRDETSGKSLCADEKPADVVGLQETWPAQYLVYTTVTLTLAQDPSGVRGVASLARSDSKR